MKPTIASVYTQGEGGELIDITNCYMIEDYIISGKLPSVNKLLEERKVMMDLRDIFPETERYKKEISAIDFLLRNHK